jgi:KDO2-lipid IV(A) lauroyltransferase
MQVWCSVVVDNLPTNIFGKFIYYLIKYRRAVVIQNINRVYQDTLNASQKKHLAISFYSHLCKSIYETFSIRFKSLEQIKNSVVVKGHQNLLDVAKAGKGVLIVTGHFGNWEYAPIGGIQHFAEFKNKFHFIRRRLVNQFFEKIVFRRYYQAGLNVIPKKNSLSQVCAALEQNHAVVFVLDQHASLANRDGIAVDFFGHKAGTYRSLASIAMNYDLPVVPAANYRQLDGKHVLEFYPPIMTVNHECYKESLHENTRAYNTALENIILAHPEQWIWFHKRWKI